MDLFTEKEYEEFYKNLDSPVTGFDCGTLCAPGNNGIPVCCHGEQVVPVLYKSELKFLQQRTDMWTRYKAQTRPEKKLREDMRKFDTLAHCKGIEHCDRRYRSLVCRTFPFEPYVNQQGEFVGILFNDEYEGSCPLIGKPELIRPKFIRECFRFFQTIISRSKEDAEMYIDVSQTLRRRFAQKKRIVWAYRVVQNRIVYKPVYVPSNVKLHPPRTGTYG